MGVRRSQHGNSLAAEIRNLPSQPASPANVLFRESLQCKQRVQSAQILVAAIQDSSSKYPDDGRSGGLPVLPDMQPPLV